MAGPGSTVWWRSFAHAGIELPLGGPADGPTADTAWGLANRKNSLFLDTLERSGIRAFPGSVAFLHELRARDRRTGVVTASRNADRILAAAGVGDLFDVQVDGTVAEAEGLAGKPDPRRSSRRHAALMPTP